MSGHSAPPVLSHGDMSGGGNGREHWGSRLGFILATIGSAAGLGNVWRFPYVAGENGGAAFLIVYLVFLLLIGLPLVMAELAIGRRVQGDAVQAFQRLSPGRPWVLAGYIAVCSAFVILGFYGVIAGWSLKFFAGAILGQFEVAADTTDISYFERFIASPVEPVIWQFVMMAATVAIVAGGVRRGIERLNRVLIPMLGVVVIGLAGYTLSFEGARGGLAFLFSPDWSALGRPNVYLAAVGQAFFSLGIGMALFLTYGSYLARGTRLPGAALVIVAGDTLFALIAGIAIFAAVFAFGMDPAAGPRLAFITLPRIFHVMPGGEMAGALFFLLLSAAALTSMVSVLEVPVAYLARVSGLSRRRTAVLAGALVFLVGVPASLGYGVLDDVRWSGRGVLDSMDFVVSNFLLPAGGLAVALFAGWGWGRRNALGQSDLGTGVVGNAWLWVVRLVAPALIVVIFLRAVGAF